MSLPFTFTRIAEEHMRRRSLTDLDVLGAIPSWLWLNDPAGAVEQIDRSYGPIGGGWRDTSGHTLNLEHETLRYPGDPPRYLLARADLRDEKVLFFDGAWIAVVQADGSSRVARID